uniref:Uncharacterized protein n=1 Tax=Arundo donax TaxID=35708 RepID=A0A0A9A2W0_ARUDO
MLVHAYRINLEPTKRITAENFCILSIK